MDLFYKISIVGYIVSLAIELKYLAVPSEESQQALLKSGLDSWKLFKFVLGGLGILAFIFIMIYPFIFSNIIFNLTPFIIGMILIWLGRFLTFYGSLDIRNHFRKDKTSLMTKGTFRYSRNPILLGLNLTLLGFTIAIASLWLFVLSLLFYVGMHIKVLDEEVFLSQRYGQNYISYKKLTGRYF